MTGHVSTLGAPHPPKTPSTVTELKTKLYHPKNRPGSKGRGRKGGGRVSLLTMAETCGKGLARVQNSFFNLLYRNRCYTSKRRKVAARARIASTPLHLTARKGPQPSQAPLGTAKPLSMKLFLSLILLSSAAALGPITASAFQDFRFFAKESAAAFVSAPAHGFAARNTISSSCGRQGLAFPALAHAKQRGRCQPLGLKMGFLDGIQNMLKSKTGTDTYLNQLKGMLSEKDFDAVKQAIDRIVVKNYEDMKRVQDTALNDARKHQKEARPPLATCFHPSLFRLMC
eukprot:261347-Rhodomonas_salina.1